MKKLKMMNWAWLIILALFAFSSCEKDEEEPKIPVEDGIYVFGAGTAVTDYGLNGLLKATRNEVGQADRAGLYEIYIAVKAGTDGFNLGKVTGGKAKVYGPGDDYAEVAAGDKISDEPTLWFSRGSAKETSTKFTVPEDGLYHIIYDETLNKVAVARVEWGIIGGATVNGWGGSTQLTPSAFDLNSMTFTKTEVILTVGDYKFRYSNGWKIVLDGELVRVNTNFGGAVNALVPGGDNIANATNGYYTITISWSLTGGTTATVTKTADYTPPSYPDNMYIAGAAVTYGWNPGSANSEMHKCAGGAPSEGIFWKICYIEGGQGFKLSNASWSEPNLDYSEVNVWDPNGVAVTASGGDWTIATSGLYMVVLNLRDNQVKVSITVPEVYGMDVPFSNPNWTSQLTAAKFTVDNSTKNIVSPAVAAAGNLRSYVYHAWIPSWWNAEFIANGGAIVYRNDGGDPAAVALAVGQHVTYHFDDNTATIAK